MTSQGWLRGTWPFPGTLGEMARGTLLSKGETTSAARIWALVMAGFWAPQLISVPIRQRNQKQRPDCQGGGVLSFPSLSWIHAIISQSKMGCRDPGERLDLHHLQAGGREARQP